MSVLTGRIAEIEQELDFLDRDEKFEWLIDRGKSLRVEGEFSEEDLVKGCQSRVWLRVRIEGDVVRLEGTSDALIVKGIVGLLAELFDGVPSAEVVNFDFIAWMARNGLSLSFQRMQGLAGMLRRIQSSIG